MNDHAASGSPALTVKANFTWNFAGKLVYAASRALILILIAKLGSVVMVGQYALAFAIATPIFMLADLDLRSILATDMENKLEFGPYLGLRFITTLLAMGVLCVFMILQGNLEAGPIIILVGIEKSFEAISDIFFGLLQKNERLDKIGISLMIKGISSILVMSFFLWQHHSLTWGLAGITLVWLAVLIFYDIRVTRPFARIRIRLAAKDIWSLVKLSIPLGAVLLFTSLNKNLTNYFIEAFHGSESLGYFASMIYIMTTGSLVVGALSQSTNAKLARYYNQGDIKSYGKVLASITYFAIMVGICMLLASALGGRQILSLLYSPDYAVWQNVFVLIMGTSGLAYVSEVTSSALVAARKFKIQPLISGSVLVAGFFLNLLLVPAMGLIGAAFCILATSCLQLAGNLIALFHAMRKRVFEFKTNYISGGAAGLNCGITIECITHIEGLTAKIISEWKELLAKNNSNTVFSDPDWLIAWWRSFGTEQKLMILVLRKENELIAIFPLKLSGKGFSRRIAFMGYPQATHIDIACREIYTEEAFTLVLSYLRETMGTAIINLSGLRESSNISAALEAKLNNVKFPHLKSIAPSPVVDADSQDYDTFCKSRFSSHTLKNMQRDENRLAKLGKVTCRELKDEDMTRAFRLHDIRWRKKMDTSGFTQRKSRSFFTELLNCKTDRWKTMALGLYLNERLIAFKYGFICGTRALLYISAYDDLFNIYAPGRMIHQEYIRYCLSAGISTIDLGVGYEEYKAQWTDERDNIVSFVFPNENVLSKMIFSFHYVKGILKNKLKQSRKIILFKRNSLGKLKFFFSYQHLTETVRHIVGMIRQHGALGYLTGLFYKKSPIELHFQDNVNTDPGILYDIEEAKLDDAKELALLSGCKMEDIIGRFYRMSRCFVFKKCYAIVCAAWLSNENGRTVISDYCMDLRLCSEQDIKFLLQGILAELSKQNQGEIFLALSNHDGIAVRAAHSVGFSVSKARPENEINTPERKLIKLSVLNSFTELEPYIGAWNGILQKNGNANPFLTPEWIINWWNFYGNGKDLYVLMLTEDDTPVGFCPLMMIRKKLYKEIRFIGYSQAGRMGFVVKRGYEGLSVKQFIGHLLSIKGTLIFTLHGMNREDVCCKLIRKTLGNKLCFVRSLPSPIIDLKSTTWDDFFKERQRHNTIKLAFNREKSLEKLCKLQFVKTSPEEMNVIFQLHDKRWSRKVDGNGFSRGVSRDFFSWIANNNPSPCWNTHVYLLKSGKRPIGFIYGILYNGRFLLYRIAHDDDFALFKPGMIAVKKILEECFELGNDKFDFAAGDEQYKQFWTDEIEWVDSIQFGTNTAAAAIVILTHILKHAIRQFLKRSDSLAHFKRVTLGRIRYLLSGKPALAYLRRIRNAIRYRGLASLSYLAAGAETRSFIGGARRIYAIRSALFDAKNCAVHLRTAALDEVDFLSDLTYMKASDIVHRYYKGSQCQILLAGDDPVGFAWIRDTEFKVKNKVIWSPAAKGDRCIYDICIFKQCEMTLVSDALTCLAAQPLPSGRNNVFCLSGDTDRRLKYVADKLFQPKEQFIGA